MNCNGNAIKKIALHFLLSCLSLLLLAGDCVDTHLQAVPHTAGAQQASKLPLESCPGVQKNSRHSKQSGATKRKRDHCDAAADTNDEDHRVRRRPAPARKQTTAAVAAAAVPQGSSSSVQAQIQGADIQATAMSRSTCRGLDVATLLGVPLNDLPICHPNDRATNSKVGPA